MAEDIIKTRGTTAQYKNTAGGAALISEPVIGVVKTTIDQNRNGTIGVYVAKWGGSDPNDSKGWLYVKYLSPFYGYTEGSNGKTGWGDYTQNPHSYGFWATPPDVGTEVLCVFANGDPSSGYYIGCIPKAGYTHMIPAIGSAPSIVPNKTEATSYGGAKRLPTTEITSGNAAVSLSPTFFSEARPIHSYQASLLNRQGLLTDNIRGTIGSTVQRESPSAVFGISTPGRAIYSGAISDSGASDTNANTPPDKLKVLGRRGGHSIVMDDGDVGGADQLIRIRTAQGHQITMSDDGQALFIVHSNGQSYIELGKEGTVDIFSTNSFNVRTQGDINLHADRDINMHAGRNLNAYAGQNIGIESTLDYNLKMGGKGTAQTAGVYTHKVGGAWSVNSSGQTSIVAAAEAYFNGSKVNFNTGSGSTKATEIATQVQNVHSDTKGNEKVGFVNSPGMLQSITSRAPAHAPWDGFGKGVDVKIQLNAPSQPAAQPKPEVQAATVASPSAPAVPTTAAAAASVPASQNVGPIDKNTTKTGVSQIIASASGAVDQVKAAAGGVAAGIAQCTAGPMPIIGVAGQTPMQLEQAGLLKPGSGMLAQAVALKNGGNVQAALTNNLWTGKDGINSLQGFLAQPINSVNTQVNLMQQSYTQLKNMNMFTGNENPGAILGVVSAGATAGIPATVNFIKGAAGMAGTAVGLVSSGIGKVGQGVTSVKELISGGNLAGKISDSITGGLGSLADAAKGAFNSAVGKVKGIYAAFESSAQQLYYSVVNSIPDMKASVPNDLTQLAKQAENNLKGTSAGSIADTISNAGNTISKVGGAIASSGQNIGGALNNATGGLSAPITNVLGAGTQIAGGLTAGVGQTITGVTTLATTTAAKIANLPKVAGQTFDQITAVPGQIGSAFTTAVNQFKGTNLTDLTNVMNTKISSLLPVGNSDLKLPPIAENTVNSLPLKEKQDALLGNPAVVAVAPPYNAPPPTPVATKQQEQSSSTATQKAALDSAEQELEVADAARQKKQDELLAAIADAEAYNSGGNVNPSETAAKQAKVDAITESAVPVAAAYKAAKKKYWLAYDAFIEASKQTG